MTRSVCRSFSWLVCRSVSQGGKQARKKFRRRSQPEFPEDFQIVDFQSLYVGGGFSERRNGNLRAAPGCRTFSLPGGKLHFHDPIGELLYNYS